MKVCFDINHMPEDPTFVLAYKDGRKIGGLSTKDNVVKGSMMNPNEISFQVYKEIDGVRNTYWDHITDFKLVWYKETNRWFEAKVFVDETNETVKQVICTDLGRAELSQIKLFNVEINTELDIAREDYKIATVLYNKENPEASLLHRIMEKAPHYEIGHVDERIAKLQRMFSFNGVSICDAFKKIEEEIGCIFEIVVYSDSNGKLKRIVSVYDLESKCRNCGYRGEYTLTCPECGSDDIDEGYGEDTTIFITSDELAESIQLETKTDAVKNCFKLVAGDDLMTATIRNCNPNGTDYIWYISDSMKKDMSDELVKKLDEYKLLQDEYDHSYVAEIDSEIISQYNQIVEKYQKYHSVLEKIDGDIVGYAALMKVYYDAIDLETYLTSELMPNIEISDTAAVTEAAKLNSENMSPVAVEDIENLSVSTANSIVLSMAKVVVDPRYRVKIESSELNELIWSGTFKVENYSDDEDCAVSPIIDINISDDYERFVKQKIEKTIRDEKDHSISVLFSMEIDGFRLELEKYCLNRLISLRDACQACIDILMEHGISDGSLWEAEENDLYNNLYVPYKEKLNAIEAEILCRENEIHVISGEYDVDGEVRTHGILSMIDAIRDEIRNALDYQTYLGHDLWIEFCSFRREDEYSNENYVSDGLNNSELFKNANDFFKKANEEIYKSAELQHCISAVLKNLLTNRKFYVLLDMFDTGNWIRILVNDVVYKLRLIEYEIMFGESKQITVDFSDVMKTIDGVSDQRSIMEKMISISSSYDGVKKQAEQGSITSDIIKDWRNSGLDTTNTKIVGAKNQTQTWDSNGMLFRGYDPLLDTYDDEQIKIVNSTIAITNDQWNTTKTAIGRIYFRDPETNELRYSYGVNGETLVGKVIIGESLGIYNSNGKLRFNHDGLVVSNDKNSVIINPNDTESIFSIKNTAGNILSFDEDGDLIIVGNITAKSLTLLNNDFDGTPNVSGFSDVAVSGQYNDLINAPDLSDVALSGDYNDLINRPNHLEAPSNAGLENQYLQKTESGSLWVSASSSISSNGSTPVSGGAVYNYAVAKSQGSSNANKILYVGDNGEVSLLTVTALKTLLGI